MNLVSQEPLWISHRGLCQNFLENTKEAFKAAEASGFDFLETDLRLTKDQKIVLLHDCDLSRITGGAVQSNTEELSSDEIKSIDLPTGQKILFMKDFMEEFKNMNWVFDIKPETAHSLIQVLSRVIRDRPQVIEKTYFLFWSKTHEKEFLNLFPKAKCFQRETKCYRANLAFLLGLDFLSGVKSGEIYSIPPRFKGVKLLKKSQVEKFHKKGAKVIAYLPDSKTEIQVAKELNCDFIISNLAKI